VLETNCASGMALVSRRRESAGGEVTTGSSDRIMLTGEKEEGLRSQRRTVVVGAVLVPEARVLDVGRREHEGRLDVRTRDKG
jgi:hypothetical protein